MRWAVKSYIILCMYVYVNTLAKNVQHVTEMCNTRRFHFFSVRFFYSKKIFWWKKCLFLFIGRRFLNQKAQFFNKILCYNPTICPVQTVLKNSSSGQRKCQTKFYVRVSAGEKKSCLVFCQSLLKKSHSKIHQNIQNNSEGPVHQTTKTSLETPTLQIKDS